MKHANSYDTNKTKKIVIMALLIAVSFVGANIKIFGTIAFDSLPGFLAALLLGPWYGAAIGFLGHLLTAMTSGFPLSIPMHLVIAVTMAITMLGFGYSYIALKNRISETAALITTGVVGFILNVPFSLACSMMLLAAIAGREIALGLLVMLLPLAIASAANIILAITVFKSLKRIGVNSDESVYKA